MIGPQGCGKNATTDRIATLTAPYSSRNITNINDITGQFNSLIENKVFAVCNELKSDKDNKAVDTQQLKSLNTENSFVVNEKFVRKREAQNVVNLVFISNNMAPFKVDIDDRRYLYLQCSMPEDKAAYFGSLHESFKHPEFYNTLLTYLTHLDVSKDYDFVHNLPTTELKEATANLYKSPFEDFITENYQDFIDGWNSSVCLEQAYNELNTYNSSYSKKLLTVEFIKYCGKAKQLRKDGTKIYCYQLLPCYAEKFKPRGENVDSGGLEQLEANEVD
jgi:hypothetical protein